MLLHQSRSDNDAMLTKLTLCVRLRSCRALLEHYVTEVTVETFQFFGRFKLTHKLGVQVEVDEGEVENEANGDKYERQQEFNLWVGCYGHSHNEDGRKKHYYWNHQRHLWLVWLVWFCVVWCSVVSCGVVRCGAVWCGVVRCGAVWCGVVRCGVVSVVLYGVV